MKQLFDSRGVNSKAEKLRQWIQTKNLVPSTETEIRSTLPLAWYFQVCKYTVLIIYFRRFFG